MRHLDEGTLRRLQDDQFAASNSERDHLAGCERCRRHADVVAGDAVLATRLFSGTGDARSAPEPALVRLRQRVAFGADVAGVRLSRPSWTRRRWVLGAVAAPVVVSGLLVSANAAGWLTIFSPTQVAPVVLTSSDVSGLPDLSGYGRMKVDEPPVTAVADASHAAAASGLPVLQPASLPANVPTAVRWQVFGHGSATFTLDAAAAQAAAVKAGRPAPNIPSNLDGASVTLDGGPAAVAVYGSRSSPAGGQDFGVPTLAIAESMRPTASTNGASLQQLKDFLLAQPGISPQLAAAIRAIGDPASTLPIPVISGLMTSQTITIDGVQGVVAGDSTGLGSAVIWEKDGIVHAVGGTLPSSEVVDIARSLH